MPLSKKKNKGESLVWLSSLGLTVGLLMIIGILTLITIEGVSIFWPKNIYSIKLKETSKFKINNSNLFAGEKILTRNKKINKINVLVIKNKETSANKSKETQFYVANRDIYGFSFHYVNNEDITKETLPKNIMMIDRNNDSRAILIPQHLIIENNIIKKNDKNFIKKLNNALEETIKLNKEVHTLIDKKLRKINKNIKDLAIKAYSQTKKIKLTKKQETLFRRYVRMESSLTHTFPNLDKVITTKNLLSKQKQLEITAFISTRKQLSQLHNKEILQLISIHKKSYSQSNESIKHLEKIKLLKKAIKINKLVAKDSTGKITTINIGHIASYYFPNQLSLFGKFKIFCRNIKTFLFDDPREANTQGGVFPAIVGTFFMTILMTIAVTPLGVITAIYLREYAKQNTLTKFIRIAINNLAGIPSIVFGAFGLGFFIYGLGYSIDQLFFSDHVESGAGAVFGTGGILWSSLTLALMTLPVVIVASEEALSSVSKGLREGSLGCGASKWQMTRSIVLPTALPGIITGIILAMARGAGEVAPLMLVGVVKVAPNLPIDTIYPYIHLDYKFMHLGFHIYDLGFQSPDSEAAKPMVFATTLLLLSIVFTLNLIGIYIRQRLNKKYSSGNF